MACLCFGVKASVQLVSTQTKTARVTVRATTTATVTSSATSTITNFVTQTETSISTVLETTLTTVTATSTTVAQVTVLPLFGLTQTTSNRKIIIWSDNYVYQATSPSDGQASLIIDSDSRVVLVGNPSKKFTLHRFQYNLGFLSFNPVSEGITGEPITCSINGQNLLKCATLSGVSFNQMLYCGGTGYVYFGIANDPQSPCPSTELRVGPAPA